MSRIKLSEIVQLGVSFNIVRLGLLEIANLTTFNALTVVIGLLQLATVAIGVVFGTLIVGEILDRRTKRKLLKLMSELPKGDDADDEQA